jgi:hypothetical protein
VPCQLENWNLSPCTQSTLWPRSVRPALMLVLNHCSAPDFVLARLLRILRTREVEAFEDARRARGCCPGGAGRSDAGQGGRAHAAREQREKLRELVARQLLVLVGVQLLHQRAGQLFHRAVDVGDGCAHGSSPRPVTRVVPACRGRASTGNRPEFLARQR